MLKGMKTSLNPQPPLLINNLMPLLHAVHPVKQGNEPRPAAIEPLEAFDEMERGCFGAIFCHSLYFYLISWIHNKSEALRQIVAEALVLYLFQFDFFSWPWYTMAGLCKILAPFQVLK